MAYDNLSPAQGHGALSDIDIVRNNTNSLRSNESSVEATPPSNPVAGQWWWASDTKKTYQRLNAGSWQYLWQETDLPVLTSTLGAHTGANITGAVTVHGIRQGAGNGFDADKLDGQEGSYYLAATHATAITGTHGAGAGVILSAPSTTPFLIVASTAPTGWTQVTAWNDKVIRIVSGIGGGTGGAWTIMGHTHSVASDGAHGHSQNYSNVTTDPGDWAYTDPHYVQNISGGQYGVYAYNPQSSQITRYEIAAGVQSVAAHSHGGATGAVNTDDISWRPAYVDVIAVTKNAA